MGWMRCGLWPALAASFVLFTACADEDAVPSAELAGQRGAVCTTVRLISSTNGPLTAGAVVTLTASASCDAGTSAEYEFTASREGSGETTLVRAFGSSNQASWNTAGLGSGQWRVTVSVRDAGVTTSSVSTELMLSVGSVCLSPRVSASPSGAGPGSTVALTASSTCTSGTPEYRFLSRAPGAADYVEARTWGSSKYGWDTTGLTSGSYAWKVESRAVGNLAADASVLSSYSLNGVCRTNLTASASPLNGAVGVPVDLTASVSCNGTSVTPELRFSYRANSTSTYTVLRDWAVGSATWDTTGLAPGKYWLRVESRAQGTVLAQATREFPHALGGSCSAVTLAASPTSPQAIGTLLTLSGSATCTGGVVPEYRFLMRAPGATSDVELRGWGGSSFDWDTTGAAPGPYRLIVQGRAHAAAAVLAWSMNFQLGNVCNSVAASILPASTQPAGTTLLVNARATCLFGGSAEYRFSSRLLGASTWSVFRDWSPLSAASHDTSLEAAGTYDLNVEVRGIGQTTNAQGFRLLSYTLTAACAPGLVPNGAGGCADPQVCDVPFVAQGDIYGAPVAFAGGATLPAGTYTLAYNDGCMKYAPTQAWALHATANGGTGWVVGPDQSGAFESVTPGTVGYTVGTGGYGTYEGCVSANRTRAPVTFAHTSGALELWLNDPAYGDNVAGKQAVSFTLRRQCPAPRCDDGVKNGTETDVDCGGSCAPCGTGQACSWSMDCSNYSCMGGICQVLMCPPLVPPENGAVSPAFTAVPPGAMAAYYCQPGYQLYGPSYVYCQTGGIWSWGGIPSCIPRTCGNPPVPPDTQLVSMTGITYGSSATYACDLGYQTSDATTVSCGAYGYWDPPPSCTERLCTGYHEDDQDVLSTVASGANPQEIAVNSQTHKAYVANADGGSVTIINGRTGQTTTLATGSGPAGIGINTQTNKIYVANYGTSQTPDNTITVIDGSTDTVRTTLTVADNPYFVGVNETTNKIYVTQYGFGGHSLTVIDGSTDIATNVPLDHAQPEQVLVNPATNMVYITHVDGYISVLDGATNEVTYLDNGTRMSGVAVNTQTNEMYFANYFAVPYGNSGGGSTLSRLDGATHTITRLSVGTSPVRVAVDELRNIVLVTNYDSGSVTVLDGATGGYLGAHHVGTNPVTIMVNSATREAYVATASYVWVLRGESYLSKWSLYSEQHVASMGLDAESGFVYMGLPSVDEVAIVTPCTPL